MSTATGSPALTSDSTIFLHSFSSTTIRVLDKISDLLESESELSFWVALNDLVEFDSFLIPTETLLSRNNCPKLLNEGIVLSNIFLGSFANFLLLNRT